MKKYSVVNTLLGCGVMVFCVNVNASYPLGVEAFKDKNYQQAIEYFEEELNRGNTSENLRYNLAVSYYKNTELKKARAILIGLIDGEADADKVLYTLAVIEKKLGNLDKAYDLFVVVSQSQNKKLSSYSEQQIKKWRALKPSPSTRLTSLGVSVGYTDEFENAIDQSVIGDGGRYAEFLGYSTWNDIGGDDSGWNITGMLLNTRYDKISDQNFFLYSLGGGRDYKINEKEWFWHFTLEQTSVGGLGYLNSSYFQLGLKSKNKNNHWAASYRFKKSNARSDEFDFVAGESHRLELKYTNQLTQSDSVTLRYRFEDQKKGSLTEVADGEFIGFTQDLSLVKNRFLVGYSHDFSDTLNLSLDAEYSSSVNNEFIVSENGDVEKRDDNALAYSALLVKKLNKKWILNAEYRFNDSDSDFEQYQYSHSTITLGIERVF